MRDSALVSVGMRPGWRVSRVVESGRRGRSKRTQAGKGVDTVNVHGAGTADALSARASEGQSGVELVLDADQGVEHHGTRLVQVERVALHARLVAGGVGVPSVDVERLDLAVGVLCGLLDRRRLVGRKRRSGGAEGLGAAGDGALAGLDGRGHGPAEHARRNARRCQSERHGCCRGVV